MALPDKEKDIQMMLAAQCHLGTKNLDYQMERYVYKCASLVQRTAFSWSVLRFCISIHLSLLAASPLTARKPGSSEQLSAIAGKPLLMCDLLLHGQNIVFVWCRRRNDGINIINLGKTYDKMVLAARVIVAIENPQDIVVLSARPYGQRAILKFASYTGAKALAGRYTPGTSTAIQ